MHPRFTLAVAVACAAPALVAAQAQSSRADFGVDESTSATLRALEQRLARSPDDTLTLSKLGGELLKVAKQTGEHEHLAAAEAVFTRLLALDASSQTALVGLAYSRLGAHRFAEALEAAREVSHLLPDQLEILAVLGDAHFALGNYAEAEALYRRMSQAELTLQSLARMSLVHQHRGRFDEAERALLNALRAGEILRDAPASLAWCRTMLGELAVGAGALDAAEEHFRGALELDPRCHVAIWRLAEVWLQQGDYEQAQAALAELVTRYPKPGYWIALGDACAALGQAEQAASWYRRADDDMLADLERGDHGHVRELVELWLEHGGDVERAAELALGDLERRRDVGAFETAAWALHKAGRQTEALAAIHSALRRSNSDARTLWRASEIYAAVGRDAEAALLLARARARNPLCGGG